ncbi:hypothetical protein KI387_013836, partial [Taxus chinensis]
SYGDSCPARAFVPDVPVRTFSVSGEPAGSRHHGPNVLIASRLFVLISADPAGSCTSRTLVPNCPAQQLVVFLPLSARSASRARR